MVLQLSTAAVAELCVLNPRHQSSGTLPYGHTAVVPTVSALEKGLHCI